MPPPPVPDRTETLAPRAPSPRIEKTVTDEVKVEPLAADDPERYEQISEHARGGLGRVVRAVDKRLGRTVAVKELLRRGDWTEARFLREALITARLEHPGIVPVHEAGRWPNGDPYYVMKLVEGRTLKELIAVHATLRDRLGLLPHVIAIADAVGYAHSEGVIHRDLKPSNVVIGEFGETIVVDWGLARDRKGDTPEPEGPVAALGSDASCDTTPIAYGVSTVSGKVVGTPAYMAPEQARGELVDERADVYAIGAVLYELLAGTPPHHDETPQATLERVIAGPPRPVGSAVAHVPSELATIVAKAMARCPGDRYPNATALAEDLRRFQTGKLVSAHSYTAWSLLRKRLSQHRGVVAVAIASAVALAAVGVESFRRVVAERNIAQGERGRAEDARSQAEKRQRELVLLQAVTSLRKDPTAALAWLKDYEIGDADRDHIQGVIDEALALGVARHVLRPGDWVFDAVFTPDGNTVVTAVRDGVVRAYDVRTGSETTLGRSESAPEVIAVSPDGEIAVTAGMLGDIMVWPLEGGEPRVIARVEGGKSGAISFSPDGTRVLVERESGRPAIIPLDGSYQRPKPMPRALWAAVADRNWSRQVVATSRNQIAVVEGETVRTLARTDKAIRRLAISPSGDLVVIHDGSSIWSVPYGGGELRKLADYDAFRVILFAWSPDERTLAVGGDRRDIKLIDLPTGSVRELRGHSDAQYTLQWTRDGQRLLSASDDATARVWIVADGTSIVLRGHDDDVYRARFSADERMVVTSSLDGSARVWQIDQPGARVLVEGDPIERMFVQGDRALVKTAYVVAWWNLASGHRVPAFSWGHEQRNLGISSPSKDGELLVVHNADFSLEVRRRKAPSIVLRGHTGMITSTAFNEDQSSIFTSSADGSLRRWDLTTGEGTILIEGATPIRSFAIAKDGRIVVPLGDVLTQIDPDGSVHELGHGIEWCVLRVEFEPVRGRLLVRRCDASLAMIDRDRVIELATGHTYVSMLRFSADGARMAAAMVDRTIRVWDAATGDVLQILRGHTDLPWDIAFSPDGTLLASSSHDKTVRIWQLGSKRYRVLRGHARSVEHVAWRGSNEIVSSSSDGTLRIWELPAMDLPTASTLERRLERATSARIEIDRPTTASPIPRGT